MSEEAEFSHAIPDFDRDALYQQFEASPGDLAAYGVMADKLDELGYADLAHAYRWMFRRGKFPQKREKYPNRRGGWAGRKVPAKFRWAWWSEPMTKTGPHALPMLVIRTDHLYFSSHAAAVQALAKWLKSLKDTYDLEPTKRGL